MGRRGRNAQKPTWERPEAPDDLTEFQKEIWDAVVDAAPPGRFPPSQIPMLYSYVVHTSNMRLIKKTIDKWQRSEAPDFREYRQALSDFHRESRAVNSFGVRLGIAGTAQKEGARKAQDEFNAAAAQKDEADPFSW